MPRSLRMRMAALSLVCYTFPGRSGVVQLAAHETLDLVILVRVQAPEPIPRRGRPGLPAVAGLHPRR